MTPPDRSAEQPAGLGPEDDAAVRRLLAEAAGPVATPPEVRARLEQTLTDLVSSRAEDDPAARSTAMSPSAPGTAMVDRLDRDRRRPRRRRWPAMVAAAAALVAAGYGTATVVQQRGAGDDSSARAPADSGRAAEDAASTAADAGGTAARAPEGAARAGGDLASGAPPDVTAAFRRPTLEEAGPLRAALGPWALGPGSVPAPPTSGAEPGPVCAAPPTSAGEQAYRVSFRGDPATMVLGAVRHGRRVAVVYGCATTRPLDATVLRAR